jgi:hypothetical protein
MPGPIMQIRAAQPTLGSPLLRVTVCTGGAGVPHLTWLLTVVRPPESRVCAAERMAFGRSVPVPFWVVPGLVSDLAVSAALHAWQLLRPGWPISRQPLA